MSLEGFSDEDPTEVTIAEEDDKPFATKKMVVASIVTIAIVVLIAIIKLN